MVRYRPPRTALPIPNPDIATCLPAPPPVRNAARCALFLDVDGTLLDFAAQPDGVAVGAQLQRDLARMRAHLDGALALVSGRPLAELDTLFDWSGCTAAGLHGAELRMPDAGVRIVGDDAGFAVLLAQARALVAASSGVLLEDKRRALALHYRNAPEARGAAQRIARQLAQQAGDAYTLQRGNHVIELKPAGTDKGRALETLMGMPPFRGRTPWMLGDDLTDEHAFRQANALGGVSVIVGARRPTAARHVLASPARVRAWLHSQATVLEPDGGIP